MKNRIVNNLENILPNAGEFLNIVEEHYVPKDRFNRLKYRYEEENEKTAMRNYNN